MRILMTVLQFEPAGGLEIYTREVARGLRRLAHEVEVWSLLERRGASALDGIPVRRFAPASRALRTLHHRLLSRRAAWILRRQLGSFDLVLCMHPMLAVATGRALREGGPPYWVWTYGTDIWGDWDPELERALAGATKIGTISSYTAGRIWARLPEADVPVVYPVVDTERFSIAVPAPFPSRERPVLLTVSRINQVDAYKGHDKVMAALPRIEAALGRAIEYRIVGRGDGVDRLRALAARLGVADRVRFLGRLDEPELIREFLACDLFVMPSRMDPAPGGSLWGEGFGIAYVEAAAAGKPVVASNQAAAPETIRDGVTGLAVDPASEEAIADACVRILSSLELAGRMGKEGRRFVRAQFGRAAFDRRLERALRDREPACAG
ncbi:MAG: glycosyltransferase family 4 protein [Actinomycetota bacterium]